MQIIIIGNGKIGNTLARQLSGEDHDLVLVDSNHASLQKAESSLDVMCVEGNGASISVLLEAGARTADLVIAVTNYDEVNIVCCLIAKKLGAHHTVARIRNPDYFRDAALLKQEAGLDMVINPELATAREISRILRMPSAFTVESFAAGRVDLVGFTILESDGFQNRSLQELNRFANSNTLLCAVRRKAGVIVPGGAFVPQVGDKAYVVGSPLALQHLFEEMGRTKNRVRDVAVVGGSRIAIYLGWALEKMDMHLRIVELDGEKCVRLSEKLPHALILHGDGSDRDMLESEGVFDADAFVALTGRDEENLLIAMNAQRSGVKKVLAKMTRLNYQALAQDVGLDSVINPKDITADKISSYVRGLQNSEGSAVEALYKLADGAVEAVEFIANKNVSFLNRSLRELPLKPGLLVAAVVRNNLAIIPDGETCILEGDRVIVVAKSLFLRDLDEIMEK